MKKIVVVVVVLIAALAGVAVYSGMFSGEPAEGAAGAAAGRGGAGRQGGGGGGNFGGGGFGANRPPMTVETATAHRGTIMEELVVVGNLVGDATVAVVPRAAGRLQDISVRLGDRVTRGQRIAKIEDFELQEQVKQQEAALEVSRATIRQREADLQLAETNAERSRNLFARQLLPKQTLDDTEARYQSAVAQLDLARAQNTQSTARLDELRINLQNTIIVSPVNGFVARRAVDPGAFVGQNAPVVDVVDITRVRLVANIVEKDLDQLETGDETQVEVDAFPGEMFMGRIARIAPVLAKIGNAALLLLFVLMVALNFRALLGVVGSGAILAALLYFAGLFIIGWLLGGSKTEVRGVLGLATAARNFGAALVPAASSFTDPKVTIMIIVGAIVCLVVSFIAAGWVRRRMADRSH